MQIDFAAILRNPELAYSVRQESQKIVQRPVSPTAHYISMALASGRLDSLPADLLDILKSDAPAEDLLDFPSLEWILQGEEHGASSGLLGQQGNHEPKPAQDGLLSGTSSGANLPPAETLQPASSGGDTHETYPQGTAPAPAGPMYGHPVFGSSGGLSALNYATTSVVSPPGSDDGHDATGTHQPPKKKRTRNAEQMQQNRIAQQKYRERKKQEQQQLQNALDQLTAQLAVMKAMEATAVSLRQQNEELAATVNRQAHQINELTTTASRQAAELTEAQQKLSEVSQLAASQQRMILDQHSRLQLQEEVIEQLKGRLKEKMEHAFEGKDPKVVCQRMVGAVRAALEGAKNVEGLQESLAQLPDAIITDICRSILCEVKQMWPELAHRFQFLQAGDCPSRCGQEVKWEATPTV